MVKRGDGWRWQSLKARLAWLVLTWAIVAVGVGATAGRATAACGNPVACENQLPGDPPSDWQVTGAGDPSIQGFATSMSVTPGQTVFFKINTPASSYHIDILRLGYYGGDGARKVASGIAPSASLPQSQPACLTDSSTGLIDCGNWGVSASWTVPSDAVSGVYIAHLVRNDTGGSSQIVFVVRDDSSHANILYSTSDATWEAYNTYGGNSLYTCTVACPPGNPLAYKGADAVSYNRPFDWGFSVNGGASSLFYAEYQMIRWLERNGYDVSYTTSSDVDRDGSALLNHKIFMSSGHDEYWSGGQRANVTAARDAGVNLAFFSGNEVFWKTRWAGSEDGSGTPYRTLVTYKETHYNAAVDPQDPPTWTGAWADPRFSPPADGGNPPNALTGQEFEIDSGTTAITVPGQYAHLNLWRNTAAAGLGPAQTLTLSGESLGYEWDEDVDNGFRPAGEFDLSATTAGGLSAFTDYGSLVTSGTSTATHHLTLYRAPSGALVFGAGTVQWSWGLDNSNAWHEGNTDPSQNPPDPNVEQFTVNLLAEMGAQPDTLTTGLIPSSGATDTTAPSATITSPHAQQILSDGSTLTVAGTASDAGGGVVAGVEVSTDGGKSWHPATLTSPDNTSVSWSYSWTANGFPATTILARAVNDSGYLGSPSTGVTVYVDCPCSIWGNGAVPGSADSGAGGPVELGVRFTADVSGPLTGVRFYKSPANTGTHIGSLWSSNGTLLAQASFTNETAAGWQTVLFAHPVTIAAGSTYVAGYFAPNGHYAADSDYFYVPPPTGGSVLNSPPLHALPANAASGNGVFAQASAPTFPVNTLQGTNYWVDVVFAPASPARPGSRGTSGGTHHPTSGGPTTGSGRRGGAGTLLLGYARLGRGHATAPAGRAQAYRFTGLRPGVARALHLYILQGSRATRATLGIYSSVGDHPARLERSAVLKHPRRGRWNQISIRGLRIRAGHSYWLALLGRGGALGYRDGRGRHCLGSQSARAGLGRLPARWSAGRSLRLCQVSIYASGSG